MAWCLTAPSHGMHQCWLLFETPINIHLRALSWEMSPLWIAKISLIITSKFSFRFPRCQRVTIQFKNSVYTSWVSVQNWFAFGPCWTNFGPQVAKKWLIMGQNVGFRPLSQKVFTQSNSNLWCTFVRWVFRIGLLLGHVGQILALWWPQNDWKWWFPTIIWRSIHAIQFQLCVYTYCVSVQNWFAFGPCWTHFGPLVDTKLPKLLVSGCYLKKIFTQCNSNLVSTLVGWVFTTDLLLGHIGQIF